MKLPTPRTIYLKDYRPPQFLIPKTHLTFFLNEEETRVSSKLEIERNPDCQESEPELQLNGEKMRLISIKVDGEHLHANDYILTEQSLTVKNPKDKFILEIENEINPVENKALEGLYKSDEMFCTQNEPEGFRRITYFLDRSDVMSVYTTKIIAEKSRFPVLLSNGNPIGAGELDNGKHWVEWNDPFKKPSYLFALVAGDLGLYTDEFTTSSGNKVDLRIYCDKGNENKCLHAMESLKKSMKWDEERFGLEYDLGIYMIVAVDAFNMGAMENKGLNIFNSKLVLANPETATDSTYHAIEAVVGHEYFHNWTGNRVTCRDWFQLTLKEGLTVYRDQEFSADMQSRPVQRISDVDHLRDYQFAEDSGPMSHPIRPNSFIEINNFYTSTVYEKGAEIIRMIATLIGRENFRKGIDKYFELYDGQAVTCEDFIYAMSIASGRDFKQFMNWYNQAGTPQLDVKFEYQEDKKKFFIDVEQRFPENVDKTQYEPFHLPLSIGLLDQNGEELKAHTQVLEVTEKKQRFQFDQIERKPIASVNRNFSSPITLHADYSEEDLAFLMGHDTDDFNRREAGQNLAMQVLKRNIDHYDQQNPVEVPTSYQKAFGQVLEDKNIDQALKSLAMQLPKESLLFQEYDIIPFDEIFIVREEIKNQLAKTFKTKFWDLYHELSSDKEYEFTASEVGRRQLRNNCLAYLTQLDDQDVHDLCFKQFNEANNITDKMAALSHLCHLDIDYRTQALSEFYQKWKHDRLVIMMWMTAQAQSKLPDTLENVLKLTDNEAFDIKNPNLVRSLVGAFVHNHHQFNDEKGRGQQFIGDFIIKLDKINPSIASGLANAFKRYGKLDSTRKTNTKQVLERILGTQGLSKNTFEIISKTLSI